MTTEAEILTRHREALTEAKEACLWLAQNADPDKQAPRGHHYRRLRDALKALEGSCRQMAHWREDARWVRLGKVYAMGMRTAQTLFAKMDWLGFKTFAQVFEKGILSVDELALRPTGRTGMILPKNAASWIIMPDLKIQH